MQIINNITVIKLQGFLIAFQYKFRIKGEFKLNYNSIFKKANDENKGAYLGWEKSVEEYFHEIREGYKNAADNLVDVALIEGSKGMINILDTYIFPIMFLYRHSIEISLKIIYLKLKEKNINGHDLYKIWKNEIKNDVEDFLLNINCEIQKDEIDMIEKYLIDLDKWDFNGENWKYASDKKGNISMLKWKIIDYENLKKSMNELYKSLEGIYVAIYSN